MMIARVLSAIAVIGMQCLLLSSEQWESVLQVSKDLLGSVPAQPMEWGGWGGGRVWGVFPIRDAIKSLMMCVINV